MRDLCSGGLAERVGVLEEQGRELRREIRRLDLLLDGRGPGKAPEAAPQTAPEREAGARIGNPPNTGGAGDTDGFGLSIGLPAGLLRLRGWEWWLSRVGVGLLLFGVAFLFKFAVDQDWITPTVRVGIGLALGAAMVAAGLRASGDRRALGGVLLGGGVGAFYTSGFAAFALYALVPYAAAFAFMVSVTLLAFCLSLRQNGAALALVGTAGGFGTPFLLYGGSGGVGRLVAYSSLVLAGACAIYSFKGWRSLLLVASGGAWAVLLVCYENAFFPQGFIPADDRPILWLGVVFAWAASCSAAIGREVLRSRDPRRWPLPDRGPLARAVFGDEVAALGSGLVAPAVSFVAPFVALAFAWGIWDLGGKALGWIALGAAAGYALSVPILRRAEGAGGHSGTGRVHYPQALVSLSLATLALVLLLEGPALVAVLAVEGAVLHLVSGRLSDRILSAAAHVIFLCLSWLLLGRLVEVFVVGPDSGVVLDLRTFSDAVVILAALAASRALIPRRAAPVYRLGAHAAALAWLWRELSVLPDGEAWATVAWGLLGVGLVFAGLRLDRKNALRIGMATLFLVVGKLFVVDLSGVEAVWRVLLFLGFGALFLALSAVLQSLWKPRPDGEPSAR